MKLPDTIDSLQLQTEFVTVGAHRRVATSECGALLKVVEKLKQERGFDLRPPLDPARVWASWAENRFDIDYLDARQIRTLCVSPSIATKQQLIHACTQKADILSRTGCLLGLINAYFLEWGSIENQTQMESLIQGALSAYSRKNPEVEHFRGRAGALFSHSAPAQLATRAVEQAQPIRELIKQDYVPFHSKFARAAVTAGIPAFVEYFLNVERRGRVSQSVEALSYALRELLVDEATQGEFYALIEALILCDTADTSEVFQEKLREFSMAHKRLGDPRLPGNAAHWSLIRQEAQGRFLSWLAKDSILFFFDYILPDSNENRRRKHFWVDYHENVRDFQVALSDNDYLRLQAYGQRRQVPSYSRLNHETTSAFLMRFGDEDTGTFVIEFSEFSETDNTAYIFAARNFRTLLGSLRQPSFELSGLQHPSKSGSIPHQGAWEPNARQQLAEFGIRGR